MKRISIMLRVDDDVHASIAITPDSAYFRVATDDSIKDGNPAPPADFQAFARSIVDEAAARPDEAPLPQGVRLQVFADNVLLRGKLSVQSLQRVVELLEGLGPDFGFLKEFKI